MLKFFSRLERTRNFVLLLVAILMALSLVLFYAPTRDTAQANLTRSGETVAKVRSETITAGELATQKESLSRFYGEQRLPAAKFMLDGMIRDRILRLEAEKLGLTATDAEVADEIRRQYKSEDGKPFDPKRYEQNVTEQFGSVKAFEQAVRDQLSGQKLEAFLTSGVSVSEEDILNDFRRRNTRFDLSFVPVSVAELAENIKPADEELKNYFEQNKKNYYIGLPQKKIRYIFVNTAKIGEKFDIPEAELKAEYDKLPEERKQAGVQGQQIVLKIAKPEEEPQVLAKADELVERAEASGGKLSEEAFAELAKGYSQDLGTALNGGRLRGLVRPNQNNAEDPYQRLLAMQAGEVSEPIKFGNNYYILRRGEAVPKTFEEAKKELEISLRNRRAYDAAKELAQKITDRLKETKDIQKTAEEFAAQTNSNARDMVRETGFVKPGDEVENIGVSPQFEAGIALLENQTDVGERIPIRDGFAIPMLVDKREPRDAEFEEVRGRVAEAYRLEQAKGRVEQIANELAAGTASAANLAAAAQAKGLKAQEARGFILGSPLGQDASAATSEALENAIYNLKGGEITKTPIKVGDNWYIVGALNRMEAGMDEFAKQRDQLVQTILGTKREQVFSDYLADVRRRMEAAGEIKIYKEALEKIDAADETQTTESEG